MQNLVTVFGGSGFIGKHTVRQLARAGWRIRVAVRNVNLGYNMRLQGDVGQIDLVQANVRNEASVQRAVEGATAVVNLVGVMNAQGRQTFEAVHVGGARNVAAAARAAGAIRMVQMSALGADAGSPSKYARTKAEGEAAVREAFPGAIVVRPSVVFGQDDSFFNRFGAMAASGPAIPLIGGGRTRFQPVFVGDVAQAIARLVTLPELPGETFELGGPAPFSFRELMELVLDVTGRHTPLVSLPFPLASLMGSVGGLLGGLAPITADQVTLLKADNVVSGAYPGLAELGLTPATLEAVLPTYLYRYRKGGQYADQEEREIAAGFQRQHPSGETPANA